MAHLFLKVTDIHAHHLVLHLGDTSFPLVSIPLLDLLHGVAAFQHCACKYPGGMIGKGPGCHRQKLVVYICTSLIQHPMLAIDASYVYDSFHLTNNALPISPSIPAPCSHFKLICGQRCNPWRARESDGLASSIYACPINITTCIFWPEAKAS